MGCMEDDVKKAPFWKGGYKTEVGSYLVLAGAGYLMLMPLRNPLASLKESMYMGRHAQKSVTDVVRGGSEGMRAVKTLDDALRVVDAASAYNAEAKGAARQYIEQRKGLLVELGKVYTDGEQVGRVAQRVKLQLEGMLKQGFDVGNQLKPEAMKEIDKVIIRLYGMDPVKAIEKSERLKEFYGEARKFYDSREKNERTVKEFCEYLGKVEKESSEKNESLNRLFPDVIARVKEGYETEGDLFNAGDKSVLGMRRDVPATQLGQVKKQVGDFKSHVDETRTSVGREVPLQPYGDWNWVDVALNPVTLALGGAAVVKGVSKLLPGFIESPIRNVLALPFTAAYEGAKRLGGYGKRFVSYAGERLKKASTESLDGERHD